MSWGVVQTDPARSGVSDGAGYGCHLPVAMDGWYSRREEAEEVAAHMAGLAPRLRTYLVKRIEGSPHRDDATD